MNRNIDELLAKSHLRVTGPRKAIFDTLRNASEPLSHMEIANVNSIVDKTSVYRSIELFIKLGVVVGVNHGWKQRYELAEPFRPHHHHLHCVNCGKIEELQSERLEGAIQDIASASDFQVIGHTFEITGICGDCRHGE
jgi:Fe2+ or Zn2+ uptake regulation protein